MAKERNFNPVQAQRKADKAKALKKGKADVAVKRNERLAKRNPDRIQQQISDLKAITDGGGKLTRHEEQVLEGLEKEFKAVTKARETLGDKAPTLGRSGGLRRDDGSGGSSLGKRRRDDRDGSSSDSEDEPVPEDVRSIPMPRDTPPPIPKEVLDKWYAKRRAKRQGNANLEPLGGGREDMQRRAAGEAGEQEDGPPKRRSFQPPVQAESKTVYEAKPLIRDLRKEAVTAFVPSVVRQKLDKGKGQGGLIEPEEADQLEKEGYLKKTAATTDGQDVAEQATAPRQVTMEEVDDEEG